MRIKELFGVCFVAWLGLAMPQVTDAGCYIYLDKNCSEYHPTLNLPCSTFQCDEQGYFDDDGQPVVEYNCPEGKTETKPADADTKFVYIRTHQESDGLGTGHTQLMPTAAKSICGKKRLCSSQGCHPTTHKCLSQGDDEPWGDTNIRSGAAPALGSVACPLGFSGPPSGGSGPPSGGSGGP